VKGGEISPAGMGIFPGFRAVLAGNDSVAERSWQDAGGAMPLHGVMGNGRGEKSGRDGVVIEDSNRKIELQRFVNGNPGRG